MIVFRGPQKGGISFRFSPDTWKMVLLLGVPCVSCYVSGREGRWWDKSEMLELMAGTKSKQEIAGQSHFTARIRGIPWSKLDS